MSSIGSTIHSIGASLLQEISAYQSTKNPSAAVSAGAASASDQASFSGPGKLFSELQQLQTSDPTEFKQVLSDAASKFKNAASQATDPQSSQFLNNLSAKFQNAADTGDLSFLQPPSGSTTGSTPYSAAGHHHHHHHADAGDAASSQTTTASTASSLLSGLVSNSPVGQTYDTAKTLLSTLF